MKRMILIMFLSVFILAVITAAIISGRSMKFANTYNNDELARKDRIKINDVLKSAEDFIRKDAEDRADKLLKLNKSIHSYGFSVGLYQRNGKMLFNSENTKVNKTYEVNKLLEAANNTKQIYMISSDGTDSGDILAIIDTNKKEPTVIEFRRGLLTYMWVFCLLLAIVLGLAFFIINHEILIPFKQLEHFTGEVAKGNLDLPLEINKRNPFGSFTWAFDMLRTELNNAKVREQQMEKSKKELVAVLSHDIRTPIAAIRAYGECLDSLEDKNTERSERYIKVIIEKSDELAKLSQDMFLHAISDLEKLEVNVVPADSRQLLTKVLEPLLLQFVKRIIVKGEFPQVKILADASRLAQVFENIISNAVKYAPESNVEIETFIDKGLLHCTFRDFGEGAKSEDMPFLFDKFYRGKNAKEKEIKGTGIGLYISRYIMDKCFGGITAYNAIDISDVKSDKNTVNNSGFVVDVSFKLVQ